MLIAKTAHVPAPHHDAPVLAELDNYINAASPEIVYWLVHTWNDQQQATTYKELQAAIASGCQDQLEQWQEDYANLVNAQLKPIWLAAMQTAATKITAQHDLFVFDDTTKEVREWINAHGAEFVTAISDQAREAVQTILMRGQAERWAEAETARVLRATIGLTAPQAAANVNYYQKLKDDMTAAHPRTSAAKIEQVAREKAAAYAARQHRYRANVIATTESAYAYNKGVHESTRQAIQQGFMGPCVKVWSTAGAERTCPHCRALDGKKVGFDENFPFETKLQMDGIRQTPPAHPRCRCAVKYVEVGEPAITKKPDVPTLPQWDGKKFVDIPEPPATVVPEKLDMPAGIKLKGNANLGGTGEMLKAVDSGGKEWLFKPAHDKWGTDATPFRAYVQEAASRVQGIIDPETAVKVTVGEIEHTFGALQEKVTAAKTDSGLLWNIQTAMLNKHATQDQLDALMKLALQIQREHVTDWLLCNYDAHGRNFLIDEGGRLIGVDKEQSFRYIAEGGSQKMSLKYNPNGIKFGEVEPVYNTVFRAFADGKIDINLQDTLPFIKRIEEIPDAEYREIFRDYAEDLKGKGKAAEALLDSIVQRKQEIRERYREFYSDLLTVRTGKKQAFVFADESATQTQPLAAQVMDVDTLKKLKKADLYQIAKQKKIGYYASMAKEDLIEAISNPVKAKDLVEKTKAKIEAKKAARAEAKAKAKAAKPPAKKDAAVGIEEVMKDFSIIPEDRKGVCIRCDEGHIENMTITARVENINGKKFYSFYGKLADHEQIYLFSPLKRQGAKSCEIRFLTADNRDKIFYKNVSLDLFRDNHVKVPGMELKTPQGTVEYVDFKRNNLYALDNFFRIRIPYDEKAPGRFADLLSQIDADKWLAANPTDKAERIYMKRRLVWQGRTDLMGEDVQAMMESELDDELQKLGYTKTDIAQMGREEVWQGYTTYINPKQEKAARASTEYVWSGLRDTTSVVTVLKSGGLASTKNRILMGNAGNGASMISDLQSGGADGVFTRIGVKHKKRLRFDQCYCGGGYRIEIDPGILGRTDWHAYEADSYGNTKRSYGSGESFTRRHALQEFVDDMKKSYRIGNEIIFRNGISSKTFVGINCNTESKRRELISALRAAGINEVNGVPVEKFVTVKEVIGT